MEECNPPNYNINTDTKQEIINTQQKDICIPYFEEEMKIEFTTSQQQQPLKLPKKQQKETSIDNLKESIKVMESTLVLMKQQLNSIEHLQEEPSQLKQQKIKDTLLFKESNNNKTNKSTKVKLDVGFNIQRPITPELCKFMKLETGSMISLNEVTKNIIEYINHHKLQDNTNQTMRKYINLDESLSQLFNLSDKKKGIEQPTLTYFNLHKHIYQHFTDY
jgi:hypothetical protein